MSNIQKSLRTVSGSWWVLSKCHPLLLFLRPQTLVMCLPCQLPSFSSPAWMLSPARKTWQGTVPGPWEDKAHVLVRGLSPVGSKWRAVCYFYTCCIRISGRTSGILRFHRWGREGGLVGSRREGSLCTWFCSILFACSHGLLKSILGRRERSFTFFFIELISCIYLDLIV